MPNDFIEGQLFTRVDFSRQHQDKADYEGCTFLHCAFAKANLTDIRFIDCVFEDCDLSNAKILKTGFQDVTFRGCKMLGLRFDTCDAFGFAVAFDNCLLDHASFYKTRLLKTVFKNSRLREVDFSEADLSAAQFIESDLDQSVFDRTILEKTDFSTAHNYVIDPEINRIKGAKFSLDGLPGLLLNYGLQIKK